MAQLADIDRHHADVAGTQPVLEIEDLRTQFFTRDGTFRAVDGVSFSLGEGETLGIVGESGCGKTVTALSVLRLLQAPAARIVGGAIRLGGRDLLALTEAEMRRVRGNEISMIFQEPMSSLNPVLTIGRQIAEPLLLHQKLSWAEAHRRAAEMLRLVQIPDAGRRLAEYPHQMSGGMRQRAMIAMALACNPKVLIADEPTTALDVTIQGQILRLMLELKERLGTAILLITHDLGVIAQTARRVIVMYAGRIVEEAPVQALFVNPLHPYTRGLLEARPTLDRTAGPARRTRLTEIPGSPPVLNGSLSGCAFAPRCPLARERCHREEPPLRAQSIGHSVACWEVPDLREASDG